MQQGSQPGMKQGIADVCKVMMVLIDPLYYACHHRLIAYAGRYLVVHQP